MAIRRCHVCHVGEAQVVPEFTVLPRVSSDCHPWPAGGQLAVCGRCGTVQHLVDTRWRAEVADIYGRYEAYHQAAGDEQKTFAGNGAAAPRSARLVRFLAETQSLPAAGSFLDYGCGNGAFLRAFREHTGGWTLAGADIGERHRGAVEALTGAGRYTDLLRTPDPGTGFDLITMSHCLEHLENPLELLARMRRWLSPRGQLLIQVPHLLESPFDLVVADHCSHFTSRTLERLLHAAGYDLLRLETSSVVPKELTVIARPASGAASAPAAADAPEIAQVGAFVRNAVRWLQSVVKAADQRGAQEAFGIFGTSVAGIWLYGAMRDRVAFFVDEDPSRIGRRIEAVPIARPMDVDANASVFLALPIGMAERVYQRLGSGPGRYHLPPPWPES